MCSTLDVFAAAINSLSLPNYFPCPQNPTLIAPWQTFITRRHLSAVLVHPYGSKMYIKHEWFLCRPWGPPTAFSLKQLTPEFAVTFQQPRCMGWHFTPAPNSQLQDFTLAPLATPRAHLIQSPSQTEPQAPRAQPKPYSCFNARKYHRLSLVPPTGRVSLFWRDYWSHITAQLFPSEW